MLVVLHRQPTLHAAEENRRKHELFHTGNPRLQVVAIIGGSAREKFDDFAEVVASS
jgi:hypothetical protein